MLNSICMTPDQQLMQRVGRICGPLWDAISPPDRPTSSFPKAFIMALTAGETGQWIVTNPDVPHRFEQGIYEPLFDVQMGRRKNYGAITQPMLEGKELRDYASSWGLTQILGYLTLAWNEPLSMIQNPATHYNGTLRLLGEFERQFWLDPTKDFEEFARCWNSGSPHGKTYDPNYVSNLLARMQAA